MKPTAIRSKRQDEQRKLLEMALEEVEAGRYLRLIVVAASEDMLITINDGGSHFERVGMLIAAAIEMHERTADESGSEPVA